jgi:hypothetical protein
MRMAGVEEKRGMMTRRRPQEEAGEMGELCTKSPPRWQQIL